VYTCILVFGKGYINQLFDEERKDDTHPPPVLTIDPLPSTSMPQDGKNHPIAHVVPFAGSISSIPPVGGSSASMPPVTDENSKAEGADSEAGLSELIPDDEGGEGLPELIFDDGEGLSELIPDEEEGEEGLSELIPGEEEGEEGLCELIPGEDEGKEGLSEQIPDEDEGKEGLHGLTLEGLHTQAENYPSMNRNEDGLKEFEFQIFTLSRQLNYLQRFFPSVVRGLYN
jgi:hypothetical protein